ncbi:MAG: two-component regulator propeller domain-containing protein [candidate division WOR-3 bacterium]
MMVIILFSFLCANFGNWQTFTNTNFITDICGNDSVLNIATAGGVTIVRTRPEPTPIRTFVHTDGLGVNRCLSIYQDSDDNLWIGTDGAGLAVIPKDSTRALLYRQHDLPLKVRVVVGESNRILCGTEQGLYVLHLAGTPLEFNDDVIEYYNYSRVRELLSDRILSLLVTDSFYWVGTNLGLSCVDRYFRHWRPFRRPLGDSVSALVFLPDARVVAGTEAGLVIGDTAGFIPLLIFPQTKTVRDMVAQGYDIYLATSDTLFKIDTSGCAQPVLVGDVRAIWIGETFWVGLGGGEAWGWGLRYLRSGQSWQSFSFNCISSGEISDCAFGKDSSVYLGHNSSWFSRIMPDGTIRILVSPLPWVVQIRCDSKGRIWFSHFSYQGGVTVYDPVADTWGIFQWGESTRRNVCQAFGLDRWDTKWVFNMGGAIVAIDSLGRQSEFYLPELVPPTGGSYEFAFDSQNRVWLGLTNGLEELDYNGTLFDPSDDRHTLYNQGLPASEVRSVAVDPQDRVWVATPQGGAMWNGRAFQVYTTANSRLLSNNLYRVRVDGAGRVWFLSDSGLSIFDVATNTWTNYNAKNSGIIPNPQGLTGFYTALDLDPIQGRAGIGTLRGFSLFTYAKEEDTTAMRLKVFPNPCILGLHQGVNIEGLPNDARVKVYTLSGEPVAELSVEPTLGRASWVLTNKKVATGIYLIVATSGKGVQTERCALVRP